MGKKSKFTIRDEEKLAEEVRKFKVIYMQEHSEHNKDKHVIKNTRSSNAEIVGLTEGKDKLRSIHSFICCSYKGRA